MSDTIEKSKGPRIFVRPRQSPKELLEWRTPEMKEAEKQRIIQRRLEQEKRFLAGQLDGSFPPTVENVKDVIAFYSQGTGDDPRHVMAQIQKESGAIEKPTFTFRVNAVNKKDGGSAGLAQIHPSHSTYIIARQYAGLEDFPSDRKEQSLYLRTHWASSIKLHFAFRRYAADHIVNFRNICDRAEGDKFRLAAYNMGEPRLNSAIKRYLRLYKKYPQTWEELVTHVNVNPTTKDYVSKITAKVADRNYV